MADALPGSVAAEPADAEALPSPAKPDYLVTITAVALDAGASMRHSNAEAALHEAVTARIFKRRAYSERYGAFRAVTRRGSLSRPLVACSQALWVGEVTRVSVQLSAVHTCAFTS